MSMSEELEVVMIRVLKKRYVEVNYAEGKEIKAIVVTGGEIVKWFKRSKQICAKDRHAHYLAQTNYTYCPHCGNPLREPADML